MGVDLRGPHIPMAGQRLRRANVVARLQQMRRQAVPQRISRRPVPYISAAIRRLRASAPARSLCGICVPSPVTVPDLIDSQSRICEVSVATLTMHAPDDPPPACIATG